jgi:hypothetical protein
LKIAVIAWGSLIWDARDLAIECDFEPSGPRLPVEFCRVSGDGRLTLVIDEACGADCITYCATSLLGDLGAAIENLRVREGMPGPKGVGFVDIASGKSSDRAMERHPKAVARITTWGKLGGYDAAIWTALASNFGEKGKAREPFSVDAALRYLSLLDASAFDGALNYIRLAPPEVQTPVRAAVSARWPID